MKLITIIIIWCSLIYAGLSSATTVGGDGVYYGALPMLEACLKYFPNSKQRIEEGYNKFVSENKEHIDKLKNKNGYESIVMKMRILINSSIDHKEVSMKDLKYKCISFYENATEN